MYIRGVDGTGKSQVIDAVRDFFAYRNQTQQLRLCAYMSIAASNIKDMTLHSALCMSHRNKTYQNAQSNSDMQAMWQGVDWLFIDEVSMLSCEFLAKISLALLTAKGNVEPFGGINVVTAGDFAQLPPVVETKLFTRWQGHSNLLSIIGQRRLMGHLLWLSFKMVVILDEQWCQHGESNKVFVELLMHLQEGECTEADFQLLNTRQIDKCDPRSLTRFDWATIPVIVLDNTIKDAFNSFVAERFAEATNQVLHWYCAEDVYKKMVIANEALVAHLHHLSSEKTSQMLGKMPLILGMLVYMLHNFDIEHEIINSARGISTVLLVKRCHSFLITKF